MGAFKEFYLNEAKTEKVKLNKQSLIDWEVKKDNVPIGWITKEYLKRNSGPYTFKVTKFGFHNNKRMKEFDYTWDVVRTFKEAEDLILKEDLNESEASKAAKVWGMKHIAFNHYKDPRTGIIWDWNDKIKKFEKSKEGNTSENKTIFRYGGYAERDQKKKELGLSSFTYGNILKNQKGEIFRIGDDRSSIEKTDYVYNGKMIEKDADNISGNDIKDHTYKDSKGNLYVFDSDGDRFLKVNPKKFVKE